MSAPSDSSPSAAPAKRRRGFFVPNMPTILNFGSDSPLPPSPKRQRLAPQKLDEKVDPAKGASPQVTQELTSTASGQASPDPEASPNVKEELPAETQVNEIASQKLDTASGQENPGGAGESASAALGEHEEEPDWGGEQSVHLEEDATVDPPEASGQVKEESHGSTDETKPLDSDISVESDFTDPEMPALVPLAIPARRSARHMLAKLDPARAQLVERLISLIAKLIRKPLAE